MNKFANYSGMTVLSLALIYTGGLLAASSSAEPQAAVQATAGEHATTHSEIKSVDHADDQPAPDPNAPVPASMIPTVERPNAPSLATTTSKIPLTPEDWEDPRICGGCHTTQYRGWKGSMHANSFKDPVFQAEWALAEKQVGGNISKLCGGCHSPVGMLTDTIKFDPSLGKHGGFTAPEIAENGVFCDVCHTISGTTFHNSDTMEHGNGSYQSSPGETKRGPIKDAESPYHKTEYSEHHTQAAFCANCHNIFNPINNFPLERTYDEWKYSVYAQNDVQCQDCHMVPVETAMRVADELTPAKQLKDHGLEGKAGAGAKTSRELVHGHAFVGGNAVVTALMGDRDSRRHAKTAVKRLRSAADLEFGLKKVPNQGDLHELKVKVTNRRAGHHIPTSLTFVRELWLDVRVSNGAGKTIFRSGALDEHSEVDPNAVMFKAYAVDKEGKPAKFIWTVERFERRTTIPPKGHQFGNYYFNVPEDAGKLTVRVRLNYRSFSQHFIDHLLGEGELDVPTVAMKDIEGVFNVSDLATISMKDNHAEFAELEATSKLVDDYLAAQQGEAPIEELTSSCAACHGEQGIGRRDLFPNLVGQNKLYLINAIKAYQSGARSDVKMNAMTKDLSENDILRLATYYSELNTALAKTPTP